jgi:hypothetical protein
LIGILAIMAADSMEDQNQLTKPGILVQIWRKIQVSSTTSDFGSFDQKAERIASFL